MWNQVEIHEKNNELKRARVFISCPKIQL